MLTKLYQLLLDLIFPRECLGCQKEKTLLCQSCHTGLPIQPLTTEAKNIDKCLIASSYQIKLVADLIKALKYYNMQEYHTLLGCE